MTDEALMDAVRDGDLPRLGELFERYHRQVFQFLSRTTGDPALAEDLVQDVFVRILKYRETYQRHSRFDTWLFRIARNARADHFRSRPPVAEPLEQAFEIATPEPGPAQALSQRLDTRQLQRALLLLNDESRDLLILARYHDTPYSHIADLLEIDVGAVKVRVHRAMKLLRTRYFGLEDMSCAVRK